MTRPCVYMCISPVSRARVQSSLFVRLDESGVSPFSFRARASAGILVYMQQPNDAIMAYACICIYSTDSHISTAATPRMCGCVVFCRGRHLAATGATSWRQIQATIATSRLFVLSYFGDCQLFSVYRRYLMLGYVVSDVFR